MDTTAKPKPVHTIREQDVKAAIWVNQGESEQYFNVTFSRMYTDSEKKLKDTMSFGVHDLSKIEVIIGKVRR
ncbi:MAG: hypothetical protein NPIRA01_34060 [Nitrospirales bacterium]|nr:MAG: hypothetical protein NPIRA01_34060 [Nitrospirales bacterium]